MEAPSPGEGIRISKIGGRYLVFEIQDVARLRRNHDLCSILTGVMPQAPTQNLFSGLPLEIAAGEVKFLVEKGAAYVEDDLTAHLAQLTSQDSTARKAYAESLRRQRRAILETARREEEERKKHSAEARARQAGKPGKRRTAAKHAAPPAEDSSKPEPGPQGQQQSLVFDEHQPRKDTDGPQAEEDRVAMFALTPATSAGLLVPGAHPASVEAPVDSSALQAHLNSRGFFMTPGLRFGADYSVYPGDPFRYHAHYMARSYGWEEEIDLLDLVGSGRLATAVKKGFVLGAESPAAEVEGRGREKGKMRTFTLEWAAI